MADSRESEKVKGAIALTYNPPKDAAPRLVAKGRGFVAEKIIEIAKAHNIPVREDKDLVEMLSRLDLNQEIPTDLYRVVAEILVWVYQVNGRLSSIRRTGGDDGKSPA